jgi:hypothetical protein
MLKELIQTSDDWGNKDEIQNCQLAGLADLKTESSYVQDTLVNHLNDLLSFSGVAGFRIDAAKHTQVDHLRVIASRLNRNPYITSEVTNALHVHEETILRKECAPGHRRGCPDPSFGLYLARLCHNLEELRRPQEGVQWRDRAVDPSKLGVKQ